MKTFKLLLKYYAIGLLFTIFVIGMLVIAYSLLHTNQNNPFIMNLSNTFIIKVASILAAFFGITAYAINNR